MIIERAKEAVAKRADDPEAHETLSRLSRDLLRAEFMKGLPGIEQGDAAERIWPYTSCMAIVRRIDGIKWWRVTPKQSYCRLAVGCHGRIHIGTLA